MTKTDEKLIISIYNIDMSIEALTFDQIRIFLTVAETGTFSAAAKKLGRVQSAVSYAINNLEATLEVRLFDRSQKRPQLTHEGCQLLADARAVDLKMIDLKARAKGMSQGVEPKLSLVVDVLYPLKCLSKILADLNLDFPTLPVELHVESLGATAEMLETGKCEIGILGPLIPEYERFELTPLSPIHVIPVCSPSHPLAAHGEPLTQSMLSDHNQLVLSDRSTVTTDKDFAVLSPKTWRLTDIGAKKELLLAGLGWGFLPAYMVEDKLQSGDLVELALHDQALSDRSLSFSLAYRKDNPPGPGGRRLSELVKNTVHA